MNIFTSCLEPRQWTADIPPEGTATTVNTQWKWSPCHVIIDVRPIRATKARVRGVFVLLGDLHGNSQFHFYISNSVEDHNLHKIPSSSLLPLFLSDTIFWIWPYFVFWGFGRRILLTHPVILLHTHTHTSAHRNTQTSPHTHTLLHTDTLFSAQQPSGSAPGYNSYRHAHTHSHTHTQNTHTPTHMRTRTSKTHTHTNQCVRSAAECLTVFVKLIWAECDPPTSDRQEVSH